MHGDIETLTFFACLTVRFVGLHIEMLTDARCISLTANLAVDLHYQ